MRPANRCNRLLVGSLMSVSLLAVIPPGAAFTSRNVNETEGGSLFYSAEAGTPPMSKPHTISTTTNQSAPTTTTIKKKSKTGSTTEKGFMEKTALVTGSVLCSAVYTPAKAVYAAGGTLTGGAVYLMSAGQSSTAAGKIITRSTQGDWFVRPSHLSGDRSLRFDATPEETKRRSRRP